jgi:uridine kinase
MIVAVAGPVGAGKTSLVRALARRVADATAIHLDHYETFTHGPVADLEAWVRRGADIDEIEIPRLVQDLAALKGGHAVRDPRQGTTIEPARFVFFETLYGRQHAATGRFIDLLLWIDTPLDLALARNLRELVRGAGPPAEQRLRWLEGHLDDYVRAVRPLLLMQRERIRAQADVVLDGSRALEAVVEQAIDELRKRLTRPAAAAGGEAT